MPDKDDFTLEELKKIGKQTTLIAIISYGLVWGTFFIIDEGKKEFDISHIILLIGIFFVFWTISYEIVLQWYKHKKKKNSNSK